MEQERGSERLTRREWIRFLGVGAGMSIISKGGAGLAATVQRGAASGARPLTGVPPGAIIRTVLKDVPPDALGSGATLFHEHLSSMSWQLPTPGYALAHTRPHNFREDIDFICEEAAAAKADGISCIVDNGHPEMGRSVEFLKEVQRRTGLFVVGSGGHYLQRTYPPEIATTSEDELAEELVMEVNAGHLGAFGEIGTSLEITPDERKVLRAVGKASVRTGLVIIGHTDNGKGAEKTAMEQLDIYESVGVKPSRVVIGHLQGFDDPQLHAAVAKRGAWVSWDRVSGQPTAPERDELSVRQVMKFIEGGYVNQLLLSSDFSQERLTKRNGGPGYAMTFTVFVPKLRTAGVNDDILHQVMYDNPRRLLAFVPKKA